MGVREVLNKQRGLSTVMAAGLLVLAAAAMAWQYWPAAKPKLSQAFYTDDDGQTWFADSAYRVPPFDHNGKTAVLAQVYTYDNGSKQFCGYLVQYTPAAKRQLESALSDAAARGQPPGSVALFHEPDFIRSGMMVKLPGSSSPWVAWSDPRSAQVVSLHSPDGSVIDQAFVY